MGRCRFGVGGPNRGGAQGGGGGGGGGAGDHGGASLGFEDSLSILIRVQESGTVAPAHNVPQKGVEYNIGNTSSSHHIGMLTLYHGEPREGSGEDQALDQANGESVGIGEHERGDGKVLLCLGETKGPGTEGGDEIGGQGEEKKVAWKGPKAEDGIGGDGGSSIDKKETGSKEGNRKLGQAALQLRSKDGSLGEDMAKQGDARYLCNRLQRGQGKGSEDVHVRVGVSVRNNTKRLEEE